MNTNMIGSRFGKLIVADCFDSVVQTKGVYWLCKCECGNTIVVLDSNLKDGVIKSCGRCKHAPRFTKDNLEELFIKQNKNANTIAAELNSKVSTVNYWLNRYGFCLRKRGIIHNCKNCGKPIIQQNRRGIARLYCGDVCRREWDVKIRRENKYFTNKVCATCGETYKTNSKDQQFCSSKCAGIARHAYFIKKATQTISSGVKLCFRCGINKKLTDFLKSETSNDGCSVYCKKCRSEIWAERKAAGKVKRNPESVKRSREHDRVRRKTDPEYRAKRREYEFMRRVTDPKFRLRSAVKHAIWTALREPHNRKRSARLKLLVGFTTRKLARHLESQFCDGMSWDNYGKWEIDHIVPVSHFDFKSVDDKGFKACWALENLRPLWATDNLKKNSKLP